MKQEGVMMEGRCVCVCGGRGRQAVEAGKVEVPTALSGHFTSKDTSPIVGLEGNKGTPTLLKMVVGWWWQLWVCNSL